MSQSIQNEFEKYILISFAIVLSYKFNQGTLAVQLNKAGVITIFLLITGLNNYYAQDSIVKSLKRDSITTFDLTKPIYYSAKDSIRIEVKEEKIILFGEGQVEYDGINLKAEKIEINYKSNLVYAHGEKDSLGKLFGTPRFESEGEVMECEEIAYNLLNKKGKIKNITTKQGELIIKGEQIKKDSNDVMFFKNISCIPCEFSDSKTLFKASRAKVIPNDKIVTGPLYLSIAGIPTPLALPFGYFPNTRKSSKSGVIIPTYGESPNLGFFLKDGGFYWAMGPKADMQIRGDIYSYGSWALKNFLNYDVRYKYKGNLNFGYSVFNTGEKEIPEGNAGSITQRKDFFIRWTHSQDPKSNPNSRLNGTINAGSNSFNQFNAQNTGQYLTNTFASNVNYSKTFSFGNLSVNARHSQNTQTKMIEISMPEITLNVNRFFPFKNENRVRKNFLDRLGVNYLMETKSNLIRPDSLFLKPESLDSIRTGIRHSIPVSTNITLFKFITFTPSLNLTAWNYFNYITYGFDSINNKTIKQKNTGFKSAFDGNFSGTLTTKVYGNYFFRGKKLKQIRHFIIPTVSLSYRPDLTNEKLGFYREVQKDTLGNKMRYSIFQEGIYGGPSTAKSAVLNYNLNNNLEAKIRTKTDTGYVDKKIVLIQNLSISGGVDFLAKEFNVSLVSLSARTKIWKNIDLLINGSFDPYTYNKLTLLRENIFEYDVSGKLARFTGGNIAINTSISNMLFNVLKASPQLTSSTEQKAPVAENKNTLPWNVNMYYNLNYSKPGLTENITQTLNLSGDFFVTSKWRVGFTSGYDFNRKNLSYTSVNVYRDLHCWEARFDWVPFGFRKRYSISINLKTSMLRDIRLPRVREWYDNL
ncbi:MAG: putative LPS assembly protein LptD [Bacteroidota bacterium]